MNFGLKRPCPKCPFRKDCLKGWLGEGRADEIASSILSGDMTFACHETTQHDEDGAHVQHKGEHHCVGAMILVEKEEAPNAMLQIAERLGLRDPDVIDPSAAELIFNTGGEFIAHHSGKRRR